MLYYHRIDVSEEIDINKKKCIRKYDICHYWYFLSKEFQFQTYVCNRFHGFLMMSMNLGNVAIIKIKNGTYRCINTGISKGEAINLMQ